jgi:hypothetical protein
MKGTAFGHPSNPLDAETAIHIVDAQIECSKTAGTEQVGELAVPDEAEDAAAADSLIC